MGSNYQGVSSFEKRPCYKSVSPGKPGQMSPGVRGVKMGGMMAPTDESVGLATLFVVACRSYLLQHSPGPPYKPWLLGFSGLTFPRVCRLYLRLREYFLFSCCTLLLVFVFFLSIFRVFFPLVLL